MPMLMLTVPEWSKDLKVRPSRGYELARQLPPGVRIELGRQLRINQDAFEEWVQGGGSFEPRTYRKTSPEKVA
ncbi:MAG: helix-turn-helix domain-containing protein [Pyrinomonadaceae bacterium]